MKDLIQEALDYLQLGSKFDVLSAIVLLQQVLEQPDSLVSQETVNGSLKSQEPLSLRLDIGGGIATAIARCGSQTETVSCKIQQNQSEASGATNFYSLEHLYWRQK